MSEVIASTELIVVFPDGQRRQVTASIGRPFLDDDDLWTCPVALQGVYEELSPMKSDDSFHALCLSVFLLRRLLVGLVERGGRLLIEGTPPNEEEFPIEAYFPAVTHGGSR